MLKALLRNPLAVRYGIRFGIVLAVLGGGLGVSGTLFALPGLDMGACFFTILLIILFAWMLGETGHFTAQQTGAVNPSIAASAVAGGIGGVGFGIANCITEFVASPHPQSMLAAALGIIARTVGDGVALAIIGAALGSFGAGIGKKAYDKREAATQSPMPPDAPPPV